MFPLIIPRSQRYASRPALDTIFNESILRDRKSGTGKWLRLSRNTGISRASLPGTGVYTSLR
jgi:hypothetical protein